MRACPLSRLGIEPPDCARSSYLQQYLADTKNPNGYSPDHGTGASCPMGVVKASGPGGVKADS